MRWLQLVGVVEPRGEPVIAPLSGEACVLYRVELARLQRLVELGRGSRVELCGARFLLRLDDGQRLLIDPRRARLSWAARPVSLPRDGDAARGRRLALLYQRLGRRGPGRWVRGREWLVRQGQRLRVSGWLTDLVDPSGEADGYRQSPRRALLLATAASPR